jgi:hypothetical protein
MGEFLFGAGHLQLPGQCDVRCYKTTGWTSDRIEEELIQLCGETFRQDSIRITLIWNLGMYVVGT